MIEERETENDNITKKPLYIHINMPPPSYLSFYQSEREREFRAL